MSSLSSTCENSLRGISSSSNIIKNIDNYTAFPSILTFKHSGKKIIKLSNIISVPVIINPSDSTNDKTLTSLYLSSYVALSYFLSPSSFISLFHFNKHVSFVYVSLTVLPTITLSNDQLDAQILNIFITILYMYMFRAISCSSSGGQIVLIQHLVSSLSVSDRPVHRLREDSLSLWNVRSLTESDDTRCCVNTILPPEDEQDNARNM